jgi:hypothetical protein
MALWKPFRGNRADLDAIEKHDGYVYFCIDDGSLFFDYVDADGTLQRKQINAKDTETLMGMSLDELKNEITTQDAVILAESQAYTDDALAKAKETGEMVTRTELYAILNMINGTCYLDAGKITEEGDEV